MTKEEKEILNTYIPMQAEDYVEKYTYLEENQWIVNIDYETVLKKLKKDSFVLYVGGAWCKNCQAAISFIHQAAAETKEMVYNFDPRIADTKTMEDDIRNCTTPAMASLYERFISSCGYENPNGITTENTTIDRMSVPTVLVYKEGKLVDCVTKEYLYDGTILYLDGDESKTDYSRSYLDSLIELMGKLV